MSSPTASTDLVVFDGAVECRRLAGPIAVHLRGRWHATDGATELLFCGVTAAAGLPAQLHDARVLKIAPKLAGSEAFRIEAREGCFELQARSMQLHRQVSRAFFRALPPRPVPLAARFGWALLLTALRLPGAARLLGRRRGPAP